MSDFQEAGSRVKRQPDGSYRWFQRIDVDYYRKRSIYPAIWACGIIAVFLLLFGVFLSFQGGGFQWDDFRPVLLSDGIFIIIAAVVIRFAGWGIGSFDPGETYELTEDYVKTGSGKTAEYFTFRRAKEFIVTGEYVELRRGIRVKRVYASAEDMPFVRSFIMSRIPGDADIRYE